MGKSKYIVPKLLIFLFLLLGTLLSNSNDRLFFLLLASLISGIYNGYYDDVQWRAQSPNKDHSNKLLPEECLHTGPLDFPYRAHKMFLHIICGFVAAISLYLLSSGIDLDNPLRAVNQLSFSSFGLFLIALTGYAGILPRAIWFWSYSGKTHN